MSSVSRSVAVLLLLVFSICFLVACILYLHITRVQVCLCVFYRCPGMWPMSKTMYLSILCVVSWLSGSILCSQWQVRDIHPRGRRWVSPVHSALFTFWGLPSWHNQWVVNTDEKGPSSVYSLCNLVGVPRAVRFLYIHATGLRWVWSRWAICTVTSLMFKCNLDFRSKV